MLASQGIAVHHLNMPRGRLTLAGLSLLLGLVRRLRPEIVQTWMYHADLVGGMIARLAGCRRVFWNVRHSNLTVGGTRRNTRLVANICARLSSIIPKRIVTCSNRAKEVHIGIGYNPHRFVVIPNGCDIEEYNPIPAAGLALRHSLGVAPGIPLVGLVARWMPDKDHGNLISAVALARRSIPDLCVLLVGKDCTRENTKLWEAVANAQLQRAVYAIGRRDDVPAVMNAIDLHVLSSSAGEAFPNVVAEAMACGTPCVVTDVGDANQIVGVTGWTVQPRNPVALAQAIEAAMAARRDGPGWAARKASARQRIVDHYSLDQMVAEYSAAWACEA